MHSPLLHTAVAYLIGTMKTSRALHPADHRAQAFLENIMWNGVKGFGKIEKHNQIGHAFVNVKIPIIC